jgi:hypothetical protein
VLLLLLDWGCWRLQLGSSTCSSGLLLLVLLLLLDWGCWRLQL